MKIRYALAWFLVVFILMQYSLVFQDARKQAFEHLLSPSMTPLNFTTNATSPITRLYLKLYTYSVWIPWIKLYLQGPAWSSFGFWQGQSATQICAATTQVDAQFWEQHLPTCYETLFRKVESFLVVVHFAIVSVGTLCFLHCLFSNWFYSRLIDQISEKFMFGQQQQQQQYQPPSYPLKKTSC